MRVLREVLVFIYRTGGRGDEVLVLHRTPEEGAYWHAVAGALEGAETAAVAATREVREETGFEVQGQLVELGHRYFYPTNEESPGPRELWGADAASVLVEAFAVRVPAGWEPRLNQEHDDYRWCQSEEARALLYWPEAREVLLALASLLEWERVASTRTIKGVAMNEAAVTALLSRIYGDAMNVHLDLYEKSERHREAHGKGCTVYPHAPANAPMWPVLSAIVGARRFLEIGCGLGYSAALMAEAGGQGSQVDTIEKVTEHADIAEEELRAKGLSKRVRVLRGEAADVLPTLQQPYDIVFMDSDWKDYPALLQHVTRLTRPGGILLTSNLFPLFEEWASSLPYKDAIEEYLVRLVREPRFRTFLLRSEWKAISYKLVSKTLGAAVPPPDHPGGQGGGRVAAPPR